MVIDASAALALSLAEAGFRLAPLELWAPVLLRSEVLSGLRGLEWRGEISTELATRAGERLLTAPIRLIGERRLYVEARKTAVQLGWAKTYDAEYVALARLRRSPLLTADERLARRVGDLIEIRTPADL